MTTSTFHRIQGRAAHPALALLLSLAFLSAGPAPAQVFVIGTGAVQNTNTAYPAPYGNWYWGSRHQMLIPAAELAAAGMTAGPIVALDFDVAVAAGQPLDGFTAKLGHTVQTSLGAWEPAMLQVFGPVTHVPATGWNSHVFCAGFVWDGVQNLVIETCHNNASYTNNCVFNQTATAYTATRYYRADAAGVCGNTGLTGSSPNRPNVRLTMGPPPVTTHQVNQPGASLLLNGAAGSPCSAAVVNQTIWNSAPIAPIAPVSGSIVLSTTLLGAPWDLALSPAALVPLGAGATALSDGQILNLDLFQPLALLNGFFGSPFPGSGIPGATSASFTVSYSLAAQTDVSMQAVVADATAASGLALSQGSELHVNLVLPLFSVPGPTQDNQSVEVNVTAGSTSWIAGGLPFFGSSYSSIHVSSNGRVLFGAADTDATPTQGEGLTDQPFAGFWTDLNPALGGSIAVSNPGPGLVRVAWTGVPYAGEAGTANSFSIVFDATSGQVMLDGLAGIQANPLTAVATGDAQFLGITKGLAGATDAGPGSFLPGGAGAALSATAMRYDFYNQVAGAPGLCSSLAAGVNSIVFMPSASVPGAYDWAAF